MTFTRLDKLGEEAGSAWRARVDQTGAIVVVKPVPPELLADEPARSKLDRLLALSSQLHSTSIARMLGYGPYWGGTWLAREYADGQSLQRLSESRGPLGWAEAAPILRQLATALGQLHLSGLAHQNLKPSNVILGPNGFLRLVDYGLPGSNPESSRPYRAPEGAVDVRSDFYSLGATAAHLVTGKAGELRLDALPAEARPLFAWLLRNDPAGRPRTVTDLVAAMDGRLAIPEWGTLAAAPSSTSAPLFGQTSGSLFEDSYGSLFGQPSGALFEPTFGQTSGSLFDQQAGPGSPPDQPPPVPAPMAAASAPSAAPPLPPAPSIYQAASPYGAPTPTHSGYSPATPWAPPVSPGWSGRRTSARAGLPAAPILVGLGLVGLLVFAAVASLYDPGPYVVPEWAFPSSTPQGVTTTDDLVALLRGRSFQFEGNALVVVTHDSSAGHAVWRGYGSVASGGNATHVSIDVGDSAGAFHTWETDVRGSALARRLAGGEWTSAQRTGEGNDSIDTALTSANLVAESREAGPSLFEIFGASRLDPRLLGIEHPDQISDYYTRYQLVIDQFGHVAGLNVLAEWKSDGAYQMSMSISFYSMSPATRAPTESPSDIPSPSGSPSPSASPTATPGVTAVSLAFLAKIQKAGFQFSGSLSGTGKLGPFQLEVNGTARSKGNDSAVSIFRSGGDGVLLGAEGEVVCTTWCYHRPLGADWARSTRNPDGLDAFSTVFRSLAEVRDEGQVLWHGRTLHRLVPETSGRIDPYLFGFDYLPTYVSPEISSLTFWATSDGTPAGMSFDIGWVEQDDRDGQLHLDITFDKLSGVTITEPKLAPTATP